jgi:hypothetical protein
MFVFIKKYYIFQIKYLIFSILPINQMSLFFLILIHLLFNYLILDKTLTYILLISLTLLKNNYIF